MKDAASLFPTAIDRIYHKNIGMTKICIKNGKHGPLGLKYFVTCLAPGHQVVSADL